MLKWFMGVSLALLGLTALFWYLGLRNPDEVIGILEKLMATMLLVLTLSFGGMHLGIGLVLLVVALSLPRARAYASTRQRNTQSAAGTDADSSELFLKF